MATYQEDSGSPIVGRLLILTSALLWSTSGAFVKNLSLSPTTTAMYRALLAGAVLLILFLARRGRFSFHPAMIVMILSFTLMNYSFIASMTYTTAANTIFLQYTAPVWMTMGSVIFLREAIDRRQFWALAGSLLGVAVILAGNASASANEKWGVVLGLASGLFFAAVAVSLRFLRAHDPLWLTAVNNLGAFAGLAVCQVVLAGAGLQAWGDLAFPADPHRQFLLVIFGVVQMGIPYLLFGAGLRTVSPQEAGILTLIEPLMNPIWTYLMAGEEPSTTTIVGGTILLFSLFIRYVPSRSDKK